MNLHVLSLAVLLSLGAAELLSAHSVHQSNTEATFNAQTQKLEVCVTVFINDLELALSQHSEQTISLEKTSPEKFTASLRAYLATRLVIQNAAGTAAPLEWLGHELDADSAKSADPELCLFFEIPMPQGLEDHTLSHTLFCELFPDQGNILRLSYGPRTSVWCFMPGDAPKPLAR